MKQIQVWIVCVLILAFIITIGIVYLPVKQATEDDDSRVRVIDGDTFEYQEEIIRLLCIDTPERDEEGYEEASLFLSSLLQDAEFSIERHGYDKYNRTLAYVFTENLNTSVNEELVDQGYAQIFPYGNESCTSFY
ncbi:thermonuclease family protein [Candidatus Pacearchaeota archaeon]|nr:thermonuclease family protein [Candidatus Pacearchaeota archaeon]